jgi:hypothetical protein
MKGALGGGLPIRHEFHDEVIDQLTDHYVFLALQGQSMAGNLPLVRSSDYKRKGFPSENGLGYPGNLD